MAIHKLTNDIIPIDWYAKTRVGDAVGEYEVNGLKSDVI